MAPAPVNLAGMPSGSPGLDQRPAKLGALTSLRFFAAVCIVMHHLGGHFGMPENMTFDNAVPWYQAVSFFFVLSGFILTMVYPSLDGWAGRSQFLIARFARVWPGHAFAFLLWFCVMTYFYGKSWRTVLEGPNIANLAMVHAWVPTNAFQVSGNPLSWTIGTEFGFYFLFLILIGGVTRFWALQLAICFLLAVGLVFVSVHWHLPYTAPGEVFRPTYNGLLYMNPLARVFEFSLGMAACVLWKRFSPLIHPGRLWMTLAELASLVVVIFVSLRTASLLGWLKGTFGIPDPAAFWLSVGAIPAPAFAILISVFAMQRGWVSQLLTWKAFVFLGEISYSIYLLHLALLVYLHANKDRFADWPPWAAMLLFFLGLLMLSAVVWWLVEMPARRGIAGFTRAATRGPG